MTDTGSINAEVFKDMSIALGAQTNAKLTVNGLFESKKVSLHQGKGESNIRLESTSGDISIQTLKPPALVHSVTPSNATSVDIDLRQVKKAKAWKPGDPIYDRDDKKTDSQKTK